MDAINSELNKISESPFFTTLLSCLTEGVLITDENGEILCLNSAFKEHLGDGPAPHEHSSLKRALDVAGRQKCGALSCATPAKSPMEQFICVKEKVSHGSTTRDLEFYCGTIALPDDPRQLKVVISHDRTLHKSDPSVPVMSGNGFITSDREMVSIIDRLGQIANSMASVLLMGESGTGKTQIARMIHELSPRADKPLVELNCAAIPDQLLESELFGHVKGAFTGATQKRLGRFQAANGGVLLLDEIGEIPLHLQAKLLRAIQDQKFEPVGSDETVEVDVRVISATNKNLRDMVNEGLFRADLFYRLAVFPIQIPALRDRVGDIPLLLKHFCSDLTAKGYPEDVACTPEAMRMMMNYNWPGNVREMINAVEHAYICAVDKAVVPESLPQDIRQHVGFVERRNSSSVPQSTATVASDAGEEISAALREAEGNKTLAAKLLGIDRTTLWRRMRKFSLA